MTSTDQFDILLQFQLTVMQDLQHRILNAAPLTTLWVNSPLSRRIEQAVPPLEVQACWNKPEVTLSDEGVELSADLTGGARQALSGRILTLDGTVSARQTVTSAVDTFQRPYVCAEEPTSVQVNLRQLKISYEGSSWPAVLAALNPAKEATMLRPVLASQLFGTLARIPLTCMPCSLPLRVSDPQRTVAAGMLPIKRVIPGLFATPASVTLGLMLDNQRAAPSLSVGVMPPQTPYNAAIALSEQGLNALLSHLCIQGAATGQMHHTHFGKIAWRWEKLSVTLGQDVLAVSGLLVQQRMKRAVVAELKSGLVNDGCLQSQIVSSNLDASSAEMLLAAWNGVLTLLLRAYAVTHQDQGAQDAERLFQCFALPTSTQTIESVAQELLVTDEQLILYYTLPTSGQEVPLEIPPPKPSVSITQPHLPQQTAQEAPVTVELETQILKDSTPPYDFAWTNDLSPNPIPQFGATYSISGVPATATAAGAGPQTLTTAHLKVIDMFGQVAQTQAPAKYLPAPKKQQPSPKKVRAFRAGASASHWVIGSLPTWLLVALAGLAVLAASGITLAHLLIGSGGASPRPGTIIQFSLPMVASNPAGIAAGPDGTLWFTEANAGKIGRITPGGKIDGFSLPTIDSEPFEIAAGPDGTLWFTEANAGKIGHITTAGAITEFPIPTTSSLPVGITAGPDGNLWFTEHCGLCTGGSKIGRITPSGTITEFSLPAGSGPWGITAGPDGNLWFTESTGGKIGRITPTGAITEFPLTPTFYGAPYGITKGPDGNLWFTVSNASNGIGRITIGGQITAFRSETLGSPYGITLGSDGNLWFTEWENKIGRITPTGAITEFSLPTDCGQTTGCKPYGITAGPDGNLWFTEYDANKIGRITPGGKVTGYSAPPDLASDAPGARTAGLPGIFLLVIPLDGPFVRRTLAR